MKEMSDKEKEDAVQRVAEFLGVKYMSNAGTGLSVSETWREKHEERMQTVGVVRGGKVKVDEGEKGKERERGGTEVIEEERKPTPGEDAKSGGLGIGEGWEW